MKKDFHKFCNYGNDKKYSKICNSTVNTPLFEEAEEVYVLEKCILPELHLMQGFVNHIYWTGIVPLVGEERASLWPKKLHLVSKDYHGRIFEGNACRKMLKHADQLLDPEIYQDVGVLSLIRFVSALKSMNKLVDSCFSTRIVNHDFKKHLNELAKTFQGTELSETLKIHILLDHTEQSLHFLRYECGLGLYSEQAGESIHREFLLYWKKRQINSMKNPLYGKNLLKTVIEFSSKNL